MPIPPGPRGSWGRTLICRLLSSVRRGLPPWAPQPLLCARASGGRGRYVPRTAHSLQHPLSCPPSQERKEPNALQQAQPCSASPFHDENTIMVSSQHHRSRGSWQPLQRHPPSPHCQSQQPQTKHNPAALQLSPPPGRGAWRRGCLGLGADQEGAGREPLWVWGWGPTGRGLNFPKAWDPEGSLGPICPFRR